MKKITISIQQRKELLSGLTKGVIYLSVVPELAQLFPKTIDWFRCWDRIAERHERESKNEPAYIELDRTGKVAVLQALQSGSLNLSTFGQVADKEESRERFLELMIAASSQEEELIEITV